MNADAETFRLTTAVHQTATASNQPSHVSHLRSYLPYLPSSVNVYYLWLSQSARSYIAARPDIWRDWDVRIVQHYDLLEIVGKGSYGEVASAKDRST